MARKVASAVLALAVAATTAPAQAQTPAAATAEPAATVATAPPAGEPPGTPEPPRQLEVGSGDGTFRPGILLQGWYVADFRGTSADEIDNTFRVRRAELSVRGEIVAGWISYAVMIDPAKVLEFGSADIDVTPPDPDNPGEQVTVRQPVSAVSMFQDYYLTFLLPYVDISLGQFKIPVSWEGYNSSARLLFPERFAIARLWGDRRDLGLRLAKKFDWFGYSAGVFNGAGLNNLDQNNTKDLALRLEAYPAEGLTIAGVAYASVGDRDQAGAKDRFEGDLRFERWGLLFQGEYIYAREVSADGTRIDGQGFYAALAYTFLDAFQPCVRVGYYDPDVDTDGATAGDDELWQFDGGFNWYIVEHEAKLQLSYSRHQYDDHTPDNQLLLAAQVSY